MVYHLVVNGEGHDISASPMCSLSRVLRERLHLTGTKLACGEGFCGSCSVLVDGNIVPSCLVSIARAQGHEIDTIEALTAGHPTVSAIAAAFVEDDVVQCGMCFPGMLVAIRALLSRNPKPTRSELVDGLTGNLCRCTGYARLVDSAIGVVDNIASVETAK